MRVRNKPWAKERVAEHPQYVVSDPAAWKGRWQERFEEKQPIHIEVGTGKGRFITEMAKAHPKINYIGIELQLNVLITALDKLIAEQLPNLQLLHVNGGNVTEYFADGEIDQVYLNFSDPWPKKKHEKRRLTSAHFLENYHHILKKNGEIHFKTDNQGLFEYSLSSLSKNGYVLKQVWLDLHQSEFDGNIMTEYEEKFSKKGQPIYRVEAYFKE